MALAAVRHGVRLMPRLRTLKPGFFFNEDLASLPPLTRLFFQGLWCWADREGRLEDRPKRLRLQILPADDFDPEQAVVELVRLGFLIRYAVEGCAYLQITNFGEHQRPHLREATSTIPAPDKARASTGTAPDKARAEHSPRHNPAPEKALPSPPRDWRLETRDSSVPTGSYEPSGTGVAASADPPPRVELIQVPVGVQQLVGHFVDCCRDLLGDDALPTASAKARVGREVRAALDAGNGPELVARALERLVSERKQPHLLSAIVGDLAAERNGTASPGRRSVNPLDADMNERMARLAELRAAEARG